MVFMFFFGLGFSCQPRLQVGEWEKWERGDYMITGWRRGEGKVGDYMITGWRREEGEKERREERRLPDYRLEKGRKEIT